MVSQNLGGLSTKLRRPIIVFGKCIFRRCDIHASSMWYSNSAVIFVSN